jgi:hypothetical protein
MQFNVGRGVIERIAHLAAVPTANNVRSYSSQFYPELSAEAMERARKNSSQRTTRQQPDAATIRGVGLYRDGKDWPTILLEASKLIPDFSTLQLEQQEKRLPTLKDTIKRYVTRHKIRRPEKKRGQLGDSSSIRPTPYKEKS